VSKNEEKAGLAPAFLLLSFIAALLLSFIAAVQEPALFIFLSG